MLNFMLKIHVDFLEIHVEFLQCLTYRIDYTILFSAVKRKY